MKKWVALILTIIAGWVGFQIGAANNMQGDLGVVFAIAVMGFFILDAAEKKE